MGILSSRIQLIQHGEWRLRLFLLGSLIGAVVVGIIVAPQIARWLPNPQLTAEGVISPMQEMAAVGGRHFPGLTLTVPLGIRIDESRIIVASARLIADPPFEPPERNPTIDPAAQYGATAFSTGFDVAPATEVIRLPASLEWEWMIRPKGLGAQAVTVQFTKPVIAQDQLTIIKIQPRSVLRATAESITIQIDVFDELGLSSRQRAWAIAIGAIVGLVAVILGMPFLANLFKGGG